MNGGAHVRRTDLAGAARMGTILIEKATSWRRIFLLDRVITASEEQKAALVRVLGSRFHRLRAGELYRGDLVDDRAREYLTVPRRRRDSSTLAEWRFLSATRQGRQTDPE